MVHHTLGSHSAMKGNKVLIHAIARMACENVMQNDRSQAQKTTYYTIPIIRSAQNKQIYRQKAESWLLEAVGGGVGSDCSWVRAFF